MMVFKKGNGERVEKKKGTYQPKNEIWQGEKEEALPDDLDEFDTVDIYN